MKKKRLFKAASVIALSAVMCGTAAAVTSCGKTGSDYEISVFIFCSNTDAATNQKICDDWAVDYTAQLRASGELGEDDPDITINFNYNSDSSEYFDQLDSNFTTGDAEDVFYLSPSDVSVWAQTGRVLDLSQYLTDETAASLDGIWTDAISLYGFSTDENYTSGETISYDAAQKGFYTDSGTQAGVYGLPKDYSNFAMAYNGKYFSDEMKDWLQTYGPATTREVQGAYGTSANNTYTGSGNSDVITYAASGTYTNTVTGATMTAVEGQAAPFIAIGVPLRYKPYNFYRFANYDTALDNGDVIALSVEEYTGGEGYIITMTGFPGEQFELPEGTNTDANAPYDTNYGYVTLTYAEFGALTWSLTCFCNTFNWWDATNSDASNKESILLSGTAGMTTEGNSTRVNVYGSGQYEGSPNPTLYMLPWLYGNDSDFVSQDSTVCANPGVTTDTSDLTSVEAIMKAVSSSVSETRTKMSVTGEKRSVDVQYGFNSENFLEVYGAFLEYASTWNGNGENCGDETSKEDNSWANFRAGNNIFYGSGTWDAQTRNESSSEYCEFRTMPTAVSEDYALYSQVKDAYYNISTYSYNGSSTCQGVDYGFSSYSGGTCRVYTTEEVIKNQTIRQDKWGARMDSVGYAVNKSLESDTNNSWKLEAAVSLVAELSVNEEAQLTLSYGGAQLPNFVEQCKDFLYYQADGYEDGTFKDMVTPEGYYDTTDAATGEEIWNYYLSVVEDMNAYSIAATNSDTKTVREFLADYTDYDGTGSIRYDSQYADVLLKDFTGENSHRAYCMKVLYMQAYTYADRDLSMRMQYGLNSARDSTMYTYEDNWILVLTTRDGTSLAYMQSTPISGTTLAELVQLHFGSGTGSTYVTAAVHCLAVAALGQKYLDDSWADYARDLLTL